MPRNCQFIVIVCLSLMGHSLSAFAQDKKTKIKDGRSGEWTATTLSDKTRRLARMAIRSNRVQKQIQSDDARRNANVVIDKAIEAFEKESKIIIDFSFLQDSSNFDKLTEVPTTIFYFCVTLGHNADPSDTLFIRGLQRYLKPVWKLKFGWKETGCRYVSLQPGMKMVAYITDKRTQYIRDEKTAKGTWAIVK